jgi:hypothetical protein
MKKFRVMLRGSNVGLVIRRWLRRRRENCGFYTTRWVVAADDAGAEASAIELVRAELSEQNLSAFDGDAIIVQAEEIEELSSFADTPVPGGGFAFFPAGAELVLRD